MNDVVAVEVSTSTGNTCYFITWRRIQDPVEPRLLKRLILRTAARFALVVDAIAAKVCETLQQAKNAPLSYEASIEVAQKSMSFGNDYDTRRRAVDELMGEGKQIYFIGPWSEPGGITTEHPPIA